ncbi:MAG: carboxylate--amine ligase [Pirellula sp.]|nr:carboxylate--amine ligase [Pirellula sp.]
MTTSPPADDLPPEPRLRVLVFPGGTELGLEIGRALAGAKEVALFSAGADVSSHAPFAFARHRTIPPVTELGWFAALQEVVEAWSITHIYPAHDDVLLALAQHSEQLRARVVTSPLATCKICRSKSLTYAHLRDVVAVPQTSASPSAVPEFPVFVKPDQGQGSQRARRIDSRAALDVALAAEPDLLVSEYLPGPEYTVDCFSDRERGLLYAGPRERIRTRSGIAMSTTFVDDPELQAWAAHIAKQLAFHGAWFFQAKRDAAGALKLLEVAPRPAGASSLTRARGINLPLLSLYEAEGVAVDLLPNAGSLALDRALTNRYRHDFHYDTVYVDLDDTLLLRGAVHPPLVAFLYQCLNRGIRLVLLTRHRGETADTLARHRLQSLFDEVIVVPRGVPKSKSITVAAAIFIDDSFAERREVAQALGIPTFDLSMLELLLDDRAV